LPARRFGKLLRISERNFFRAFLAIVLERRTMRRQ